MAFVIMVMCFCEQGDVSNGESFLQQVGAEHDFNADELFEQRLQCS